MIHKLEGVGLGGREAQERGHIHICIHTASGHGLHSRNSESCAHGTIVTPPLPSKGLLGLR